MKTTINSVLMLLLIIFSACTPEEKDEELTQKFDRAIMLQHYADGLIIPAYNQSLLAAGILQGKVQLFVSNPNQAGLEEARSAWKKLALIWQHASGFNFGPAAEAGIKKSLQEEIATFPVSVVKMEQYITAKDTLFNNFDRDSRGLYAMDFMLFETGLTDAEIITKYSQQVWRKHYLLACVNDIVNELQTVSGAWIGYRELFISNTGTDIGSGTSSLYNEFLKNYEGLKNYKFGIPLGRMSGQTSSLPEKVEAYYSGISSELAKEHWKSIRNIWEGKALNGYDGVGFQEYLLSVEGGAALNTQTLQQQAAVEVALANVPAGKLSDAIAQQYTKVEPVHTELQKMTRFYKSDLSSLLGITITYSSGDGD